MISYGLAPTSYGNYSTKSISTPNTSATGRSESGESKDVVAFSASALAAAGGEGLSSANPTVYSNETQLKGNLARILMETLFGEEEGVEESAKEELVRTLVEEPLAEEVLDQMVSE